MKIVINKCFGGFGLSEAAYERLIAMGVPACKYVEGERNDGQVIFDRALDEPSTARDYDIQHDRRYWELWLSGVRTDPRLVQVVEELGREASGTYADLKVVEIPDDVEYTIEEYDGTEHIAERHRTWA